MLLPWYPYRRRRKEEEGKRDVKGGRRKQEGGKRTIRASALTRASSWDRR